MGTKHLCCIYHICCRKGRVYCPRVSGIYSVKIVLMIVDCFHVMSVVMKNDLMTVLSMIDRSVMCVDCIPTGPECPFDGALPGRPASFLEATAISLHDCIVGARD